MNFSKEKMGELVSLLKAHTMREGINETKIEELVTFKASANQDRMPVVYEPAIVILGQGHKYCYLGGHKYDYSVGNYLTLFLPMSIEVEIVDVSPEKPCLMAGIKIDLNRLATILLKMDTVGRPQKSAPNDSSAIFTEPLNDELLDPTIRLLRTLNNPMDRVMMSEAILDEIYYRLILNDHANSLRQLLQQRGHVQQISHAIEYIHTNLDGTISVEELARLSNMSTSSFYRTFREVMHMPPLQYAKSIKLDRAQALIREGKKANEAGYLVGYNSPAQFSREYKRHFGYSPAATILAS